MSVVYDTGALVAADRNHRTTWADHRIRLELGIMPTTTAPVVAQASRSSRQARLRQFLQGCDIVAFTDTEPHEVGSLLAATETSDVVDGYVVVVAAKRHATIVTSDPDDIKRLAAAAGAAITIRSI